MDPSGEATAADCNDVPIGEIQAQDRAMSEKQCGNKRRREEDNSSAQAAQEREHKKSSKKRARKPKVDTDGVPPIVLSLLRLDPIIQFLTKATGKPLVPLKTIKATLPMADEETMLKHIVEISRRGVLQLNNSASDLTWGSDHVSIGFPPPPSLDATQAKSVNINGSLHGSTKTAAKRRVAALRRSLRGQPGAVANDQIQVEDEPEEEEAAKDWSSRVVNEEEESDLEDEVVLEEEKKANKALSDTFRFSANKSSPKDSSSPRPAKQVRQSITDVLRKQASYAGSNPGRESSFAKLSENRICIPPVLMDAFGLERPGPCPIISQRRKLFSHQVAAIDSAMRGIHTLVCTGTGSGKSLCFLLPILTAAMAKNDTSLLCFPTKALAQDQMTKLTAIINKFPELQEKIKPGIIDGDTSHADRTTNAKNCNVILTNPDTLHAAILPGWKQNYKLLLGRIKYVVIDEAHMYEGVFGAHVAMVLSRFIRLAAVCSHMAGGQVKQPVFLACSATMPHPEHHFRLLCPISKEAQVTVLAPEDDGSPRASKHFFVWNPPIMNINGVSTGRVTVPRPKKTGTANKAGKKVILVDTPQATNGSKVFRDSDALQLAGTANDTDPNDTRINFRQNGMELYRRHAADETALLLARAVSQGVRCIAFCKTRCLVEWVYERAVSSLKSCSSTEHLAEKVESYRGGYTRELRRSIESRLFNNDLLGVIGTSALELGVDVGGIDLTLHCGYPSSYASLLQQAGRAGRGTARLDVPSLAVMICFNSPAEQHLWRHPKSLLSRGKSALVSMPLNVGLIQGHLLCAGAEYPLTGKHPVNILFSTEQDEKRQSLLSDFDLFGSQDLFRESVDGLKATTLMKEKTMPVALISKEIQVFKTHPFVEKPWRKVNLRSIEAINYAIVDLSHPLQGGKMDGISDERAVLDNIPYSRVFYHAFPGAIITHRGRRFKVQSLTRPPAFVNSCSGYNVGTLAAYAKPTSARYATRPLSTMKITVVKQMERVDDACSPPDESKAVGDVPIDRVYANADDIQDSELTRGSLAGNGVVTVRRNVHGYKKLSPITRKEMSRTEFSLPPMEFDTFAFWLDTDATFLRSVIKDYDEGVHALSHAILSVAPLFVPGGASDLNCDHSVYDCTRIIIFDMRAGGSGNSAQLFKHLFVPDGLLEAAIDLMASCPQCQGDHGYVGGCPACLQFGQCLKFNAFLNRTAAILIGERLLARIQETERYKKNAEELQIDHSDGKPRDELPLSPERRREKEKGNMTSPRRAARAKAFRIAKEVRPTKSCAVVFGRPSWPADSEAGPGGRQVDADS